MTRQEQIDYITRMIANGEVSDDWIIEQTKIAATLPESDAPTVEDQARAAASAQLEREATVKRTQELVVQAKAKLSENPTADDLLAAADAMKVSGSPAA